MSAAPDFTTSEDDILAPLAALTEQDMKFRKFYEENVKSQADTLQNKQRGILTERSRRKQILLIAIGAILPSAFVALLFFPSSLELIIWIGGLPLALLFVWMELPYFFFKDEKQNSLMPHIVKYFGESFTYSREAAINQSMLSASHIVPIGNRVYAKDEIRGVYKNISIRFAEIETKKVTGTGKNRRVKRLFKGLFITMSFHKPFHGTTIVRKDAGQWRKWANAGELETVSLEDPQFEKEFEVYSTDQVEARYILTPEFMIRLLDLLKQEHGTSLECSFINETLSISIATKKNRFEVGSIEDNVNDWSVISRLFHEINDIIQIADFLEVTAKS